MLNNLLTEIETFLERSEMGASYFGKASCGNSEVVDRLRAGGRVWPETEIKIRAFILARRAATPDQRGAA